MRVRCALRELMHARTQSVTLVCCTDTHVCVVDLDAIMNATISYAIVDSISSDCTHSTKAIGHLTRQSQLQK